MPCTEMDIDINVDVNIDMDMDMDIWIINKHALKYMWIFHKV